MAGQYVGDSYSTPAPNVGVDPYEAARKSAAALAKRRNDFSIQKLNQESAAYQFNPYGTQSSPPTQQTDIRRGLAPGTISTDISGQLNNALNGLQTMFLSSGQGPTSPQITAPQVNLPTTNTQIPGVTYSGGVTQGIDPAATAAQSAALSQAKANAGSLGRSALNSAKSELAGRGIGLRSGAQARALGDQIAAATNPLSDLNVANLKENSNTIRHNTDLTAHGAEVAYQGGITQRGQDITNSNAGADRGVSVAQGNANRAFEASVENARAAQQKQQALQALLTNAMTSLTSTIGRRY